jgi:hypothetical protein
MIDDPEPDSDAPALSVLMLGWRWRAAAASLAVVLYVVTLLVLQPLGVEDLLLTIILSGIGMGLGEAVVLTYYNQRFSNAFGMGPRLQTLGRSIQHGLGFSLLIYFFEIALF